jgi:hypothetical protein
MSEGTLRLEWMTGGPYAVCRLKPGAAIPAWTRGEAGWLSITRSEHELSIVAADAIVPDEVHAARGWSMLRIRGRLEFDQVGILALLTRVLAEAEIPVFVVSTFDTDYVLVPQDAAVRASDALEAIASINEPPHPF